MLHELLGSPLPESTPPTQQARRRRERQAISVEIAERVLGFARDLQPWLDLGSGGLTVALVQPALRVLATPTPAETTVLALHSTVPSPESPGEASPNAPDQAASATPGRPRWRPRSPLPE